jgi:hypothetical protein
MHTTTYTANIEAPSGLITVTYTDADIDRIGGVPALMRDMLRQGALIAPSEVAAAAYRCEHAA